MIVGVLLLAAAGGLAPAAPTRDRRPARCQAPARPAPAPPVAAVLQRIEAARASVRTLEAEFDQERAMGLFAQTLHARGRLVVQRPDRVRWELVAPEPGVFVVAGGRVGYRAGGSAASASQRQVGALGAVLGDLAAFLGGPLQPLLRRYAIEATTGPGGATVLSAAPRDPAVARVVSRVKLEFRPDLRAVEGIDIDEPGGDRTRIRLRGTRINSGRVAPGAFAP